MGAAALKIKKPKFEMLSIQKIAFRCGLDRGTCKKRLDALGYKPENDAEKLKIYRFDEAMEADLLESRDKLTDVRIRDMTAAAELKEIKAAEARGELVPVNEVIDQTQALFGAMHKELAVRMPRELSAKLAKAKTSTQVNAILKVAVDRRFKTLRDDFEKYLK
jgi:hypothetical protein